ncbi:MAG: transposase [Patescibacteria group bacterium]|nr:transposase [Patescibacteria group bacterium]
MDELSIDNFIGKTIETLMHIERNEYLKEIKDPKKEKANGRYGRAMKTFSKNSLFVSVPRTRSGLFFSATLELLKINREKVDQIALSLYKKVMTSNDIKEFLDEIFEKNMSPLKVKLSKLFLLMKFNLLQERITNIMGAIFDLWRLSECRLGLK